MKNEKNKDYLIIMEISIEWRKKNRLQMRRMQENMIKVSLLAH